MFDPFGYAMLFAALHAVFFIGYLGNSSTFPKPLTQEEETKYIKQWEAGDTEAKNMLIEHNLRLVAHVAKKYSPAYGKDSEDLISIGTIGLIKAVSSFKLSKGRLSTYAAKCIENEILMFLRSQKKLQNEVSLNECMGSDKEGNDITLFDIICEDGERVVQEVSLNMQVRAMFQSMKKALAKRERQILKWRYGLENTKTKTQSEIAELLGISRSYVSRIPEKALMKLSKSLGEYK